MINVNLLNFCFLTSGKATPYGSTFIPSTISFFYDRVLMLKDSPIHLLQSGVVWENKLRTLCRLSPQNHAPHRP